MLDQEAQEKLANQIDNFGIRIGSKGWWSGCPVALLSLPSAQISFLAHAKAFFPNKVFPARWTAHFDED